MTRMAKYGSIIAVLCGLMNIALSGTITHTYTFNQPRVEINNGQTIVFMDGASTWALIGEPLLPVGRVQLLLPPGEEAVSISVETPDAIVLGDTYRISPGQQPYPISIGPSSELTNSNPAIYSSDDIFPAELFRQLSTNFLCGHSITDAVIHPIIYRPVSGELAYFPWMRVTIETEVTPRAQEAYSTLLKRTKSVQERVAALVQNPQMVPIYGPQAPGRPDVYDMLVITSAGFVDDYQGFVDYKNRSGIKTVVETVENIYNYAGQDYQEKIRNCIIDYYINHAVSTVFLCGDNEYISCRKLWVQAGSTQDDIPSDLYYAGLDGNWNDDNDSHWGEPGEEDLYAEVTIGRSCADSQSEISHFVNKTLLFQRQPVLDEVETALMVGEDMGWNSWGWQYKEDIHLGSSAYGYTTTGFPGNFTVSTLYEYPGISWSGMGDLLPLLNQGPLLVNHMGHANWDYVLKLHNYNINDNNFTNDGINHNFFIAYSQGCICGDFEHNNPDCILEAFTTIANGAVAFVGNSRFGWGDYNSSNGPSQRFDREFFDALFGEDISSLGELNQDSKEDNNSLIIYDNYLRWCCYELNLFGDPTLDVWTAEPAVFTPNYAAEVTVGTDTFFVSDISVQGALVTLSMNSEIFGRGEANESGTAIVPLDQPISQMGQMDLMITAHNMLPYEGAVEVIGAAVPVSVTLTPANPPVQVPASGGSFNFNVTLDNHEASGVFANVWCDVTLPNGALYGPVLGPVILYLEEGMSLNRDRTQSVPASAPSGTYSYNAYAVSGQDTSRDSFTFEKLAAGGDSENFIGNWFNSGEEFEPWIAALNAETPDGFALIGAYPNPFNPKTALSYKLQAPSFVNLTVYDISGRKVAELINGWRDAGVHEVTFDGTGLASGVYIYRLEAGEFTGQGKMILLK